MKKIIITEQQLGNLITKQLEEKKEYYDFYEIDYIWETITEFLEDKKRGISRKKWRLIPFVQYKKCNHRIHEVWGVHALSDKIY